VPVPLALDPDADGEDQGDKDAKRQVEVAVEWQLLSPGPARRQGRP
jgi:hypothetical protein